MLLTVTANSGDRTAKIVIDTRDSDGGSDARSLTRPYSTLGLDFRP